MLTKNGKYNRSIKKISKKLIMKSLRIKNGPKFATMRIKQPTKMTILMT